jgi:hypothetical protein
VGELRLVATLSVAAVLFLGSIKLFALSEFRTVLAETYGLPSSLVPYVAVGVPLAELICAGLLFAPGLEGFALLASAGIFLVFGVGTTVATVQRRSGDCGCLGMIRNEPLSRMTSVRAFLMAGIAAVGFFSSDALPAISRPRGDLPSLLGIAGILALLVLGHAVVRLGVSLGARDGHIHN